MRSKADETFVVETLICPLQISDRVLLSSRLISRTEDLMGFLLSISDDDLFHSTRRPDSQRIVDKATNITFFLPKESIVQSVVVKIWQIFALFLTGTTRRILLFCVQ